MIIGFDLDGVTFKFPFYGFFRKIRIDYFLYGLRRIEILKKTFYSLVAINSDIAGIIGQLSQAGHKILIISSHSRECAKEVGDCLKKNRVPFDKLCLCSGSEKPSQFKLKEIRGENCDLYIEDQKRVVNFLRQRLNHCQVVHYKNRQSLIKLKELLRA